MKRFFANKQVFCLWLALLLAGGWGGVALAHGQEKVKAGLDEDGHAFTFTVPGVMDFRGSFSAIVVSGGQPRELLSTMGQIILPAGQTQELHSAGGKLLSPIEQTSEETPFGRASVTEVALRFEHAQVDVLFQLSQVPGVRGFQAQTGIRNTGSAPVRLVSVTPVSLEGQVEGSPGAWLVTALNTSVKDAPPVVALTEMTNTVNVFEYGGFYRGDGNGFLFGPVGEPNAYVKASITHKGTGTVSFACVAEMSGVQVKPGETRWGQQVALFAEPPQAALPRWAQWVAKTHNARTDKGGLSGWSSWSFHGYRVTGKDVLAQVATVLSSAGQLVPQVIEIDWGYMDTKKGEISEKFSEGLPYYAQRIATTGARPGLLLNFRGGTGFELITRRARAAAQSGYTYLKINDTEFTYPPNAFLTNTSFEVMREGFMGLREAVGEQTYLLYNVARPDRATIGLMDANRTGKGSSRLSIREAMDDVLRSYTLNGRWFSVDNDSYYMGTDIANVSEIKGGWPLVRTWMSMVGLSCGAAITADPWDWESFRPYWRNVEVMTPPAREETVVLDLCTAREWPRLLGHVKRDWVDSYVALLWNPGTSERTVPLEFSKVGMNPKHRYAVWSFWDNRYLGVARGSWTTPALGPSASQHLCFTDLDRTPNKPVLIGSSLHIYCGAAEIKRVRQGRSSMEIELTDAGAREGDLFIYSRRQPVWKGAAGCEVAEIASAGENVWRINLVNRQCGAPQRIVLGILLPVTRQIWFWTLCGILAASLVFAVWRYISYVQLRAQHVLQEERVRIAHDLHDDLGSGLTEIALLSEVVQLKTGDSVEDVNANMQRIFQSASEMTQSLDEIVWAVNPGNDSLEKLITFVGEFAQAILDPAGLRCRLDMPAHVPKVTLDSNIRHQLCMILKESLHNVIKHACATEITLSIKVQGRVLEMSVSDDGAGFDMSAPQAQPDMQDGLNNMRQRMAVIGGSCEIYSAPGQGTRIRVQIKIEGLT